MLYCILLHLRQQRLRAKSVKRFGIDIGVGL